MRLTDVATWLASVQERTPPKPLARRRFLVFGSVSPAIETLAQHLRVPVSEHRLGSTATTRDAVVAAYDAGAALAGDDDLLLLGSTRDLVPAAMVTCALVDAEPVDTVSRSGGDAAWARDVATVRDALRRSGFRGLDGYGVLAALGGESLAAMAGVVAGAARHRVPVVVDGTAALAAVAAANAIAPSSVAYVLAANASPEPAQRALRDALALDPLLDLGTEEALAALLALPLLDAAVVLGGT